MLSETNQPLEISNFILIVDIMSDLIKVISYRQVVDLNSQQLSSYDYIRNEYPSKIVNQIRVDISKQTRINGKSYSSINSNKSKADLGLLQVHFTMGNQHFSLYKVSSNNLNSDCSNIMTINIFDSLTNTLIYI